MDAPLGFRRRHPLHPVATRFEFQPRIGTEADDAGNDFLEAAEVVFAG